MDGRPEHRGAAESFYSRSEASKYDTNARMATTQRHLADRALQLLELPSGQPSLLLDVGCGTGYSGRPLERAGHTWIGTDVSEHMLRAARTARPQSSHVVCSDIGCGLGFRKGLFDGAVSISAVQWLCHATRAGHVPEKRVAKFFNGLFAVLAG
jgi:18S rRNA (guanine1575-N7)-methyltransferase